jgi:sugar transferase (PEP-CTERM system associated)
MEANQMKHNRKASEVEALEAARPDSEEADAVAEIYVLPRSALANKGVRRQLRLRHGHVQIFGREISTSLILLALIEFIVLMGALHLASSLGLAGTTDVARGVPTNLNVTMLVFASANLLGLLSMGLYRQGVSHGLSSLLLRIVAGLFLGTAALAVLFYLMPGLALAPSELPLAFAISGTGLLVTRLVGLRLLDQRAFKRRVLVLGAGRNADLLNEIRVREGRYPFELVGFVPGEGEAVQVDKQRLVQPDLPLAQYAQLNLVDDVVIALDDARGGFPFDELMACKMSGIDVMEIPDFFEREAGVLKLDTVRPSKMIFSRGFRQSFYRDVAKRQLDIVTSLSLLLLTWPFMLLTALGILIESRGRGSILFRQTRVGQYGRHFTLLKFRSMVMDAEGDGIARWAQEADPRVTRFGRFIRKVRLDELPQLFNVLRGDMSFVGPRPERPIFVRQLTQHLLHYHHRHWVKPGLTGWAQINYPYGASQKDALEKLQYDLYYVKNQSMALDLFTIGQTVEVVLLGRGSR